MSPEERAAWSADYEDEERRQLLAVDAERRAQAVLDAARASRKKPMSRRPFLRPSEALEALEFEALVVEVAASSTAAGEVLSPEDKQRLSIAARLIAAIRQEATA